MMQAQISKLKSHLSSYLKKVRGGERVIVLDRETPIAQILPLRRRDLLEIRKATKKLPKIGTRKIILRQAIDVVQSLREDRDAR